MVIKPKQQLLDVFTDATFEQEEKDHRKNCSIGFMFTSMLHLTNEENDNLQVKQIKS